MTARSARWNSGRLESISATVSPRWTPSAARPPASASTRSRSSRHVSEISSSLVRTATRSGKSSAVMRKASAMERARSARRETGAAVVAMRPTLPDAESLARESSDVVGQADREQHDYEREAHETGPLHDAEGDRPPAPLLGQGPEDVPAVERQEREQVDHTERQRDDGEQEERLGRPDLDALASDFIGADHARDLLALLGLEDLGDRADGRGRQVPHRAPAQRNRGDGPDRRWVGRAEPEPEQRPLGCRVVLGARLHGHAGVTTLDDQHSGLGGHTVVLLRAGALVRGDLLAQCLRVAGLTVDGEDAVALLEDAGRRRVLADDRDLIGHFD